jgi:hypothetical protein
MDRLAVTENNLGGWLEYRQKIGFVPDPMVLRAGEIFLNGRTKSGRLGQSDQDVWYALDENIGGLLDFFDIVVTRDTIPLIHYGDTFDAAGGGPVLSDLLEERLCQVEVAYEPYQQVKAGALRSLATLPAERLRPLAAGLAELGAFRYDWKPSLHAGGETAGTDFTQLQDGDPLLLVAHFLLGGFIFSGFAQASHTTHYVQPKRSRMLLGLTAAPDAMRHGDRRDEAAIFAGAERTARDAAATVKRQRPMPPVLPYLLGHGPLPRSTTELLERALRFRESSEGRRYRAAVESIRADGQPAERTADLSVAEREAALALLHPYSRLDPNRSRGLTVEVSASYPRGVGGKVSTTLHMPTWLRLWWNDRIAFGTLRQTFRRMWMASESYSDFSGKLRDVWVSS